MTRFLGAAAAYILAATIQPGAAQEEAAAPPSQIARLLPHGYAVIGIASLALPAGAGAYYVVALGRQREAASPQDTAGAQARPLLIFARRPDGSFTQAGRNDQVVLRADQGGQCDPFLDGGGVIAVKGRYFTIENGVACGNHWTDYVTFRLDASSRFVFDNERTQSWSMNRSTDPNADALVSDGPPAVRRGDRRAPVAFDDWRPKR